ncbi:hypothetical protein LINPERHAP1_LOCUS10346, partial [Linum perenne]
REDRLIAWKAAPDPFFTFNTDGSVRLADRKEAAGGCLKDANGKLIDAFAANLGNCSNEGRVIEHCYWLGKGLELGYLECGDSL